ncbi:MAG: uridine kinase [Clostridia bacterium]
MGRAILIGIAGGSGSGKTTVAKALKKKQKDNILIIEQDAYYKNRQDLSYEERCLLNYDHPNAFDTELLCEHLIALINGESINKPIYDFSVHLRKEETIKVSPCPIIILEGILVLESETLRDLMDIKVYVDTDADVRVLRRLKRDIRERGRTLESVINQYLTTVMPMHNAFVEPSKRYADIIIPEGGKNMVAIDILNSRLDNVKNLEEEC